MANIAFQTRKYVIPAHTAHINSVMTRATGGSIRAMIKMHGQPGRGNVAPAARTGTHPQMAASRAGRHLAVMAGQTWGGDLRMVDAGILETCGDVAGRALFRHR